MTTEGKLTATVHIPAQTGKGVVVRSGQRLKVIAPHGKQVGDLFAFVLDSPGEMLSPTHTRSMLDQFGLEVGKPLYSNKRSPLLLLEEDKVGVHDLLSPNCDPLRYLQDFGAENHANCRDNLIAALKELDFDPPYFSDPVNLFQNTPIVDLQGHRETRESPARPGDYVLFKALQDLVAVVSACPQDFTVLNGGSPSDLVLEVYD